MPVLRRVRGVWTERGLSRSPAGRRAIAVLRESPERLDGAAVSPGQAEALDRAILGAVLTPKLLEARIGALYAADHPLAAHLLDRAIELRPANASLVALKFDRLRADGDSVGLVGLARDIAADPRRPVDALLRAVVALDRADIEPGDPLLEDVWRHFAVAAEADRPSGLANIRLYRSLGMPAHARRLLREIADGESGRARSKFDRERVRVAVGQDRWMRDERLVKRAAGRVNLYPVVVESRGRVFADARASIANPAFLDCSPDGAESLLKPVSVTAFEHMIAHELPARSYEPENRLLLVGNSLGGGGMERVMSDTCRHFAASGDFGAVDLALIDWADEGPRAFYRDQAGIAADKVIRLREGGQARYPSALLSSGWRDLVQRLHDHIVETRPRVIHAWNDLTGLFASFAGLLAGAPRIVAHFHHLPIVPQSGRTRDIASYPDCYRLLLARPELRLLFCSDAAANGYADWWSVGCDARFRTLYNGFAPLEADSARGRAVREALGIPLDAPVIGSVFRFDAVKQPLLWAECAIALADRVPDAHFLMVGEGPLRLQAEARFAAAGLAGRAHFPGQSSRVGDHLAAMDLFWLTSRTEGLPTVVIEAQMAGVPVIAFDVGGVAETLADGVTGRLVAADDGEGLVAAGIAALDDAQWRGEASRAAITLAGERFSRERFFAAVEETYCEG